MQELIQMCRKKRGYENEGNFMLCLRIVCDISVATPLGCVNQRLDDIVIEEWRLLGCYAVWLL
jgi:hypothetical protein